MKPYVSEILEHNGKTYTLPLPAKYRELLDCVRALGVKTEADEDDMRRVGYKSLFVPEPDLNDSHYEVEQTSIAISKLSETQVKTLAAFCGAFGITFNRIPELLQIINPKDKGGTQR